MGGKTLVDMNYLVLSWELDTTKEPKVIYDLS